MTTVKMTLQPAVPAFDTPRESAREADTRAALARFTETHLRSKLAPFGIEYGMVADRLPPSTSGDVVVDHFTITPEHAYAQNLGCLMDGAPILQVVPATYARLKIGGTVFMTDTPFERVTNMEFVTRAHGHVLIFGLGIGLILTPLLKKPSVESVTVVEFNPDVIALVAPHYAHPKLTVEHGDAFEWRPAPGTAHDSIYFDIWPQSSEKELPEMARLRRRAGQWQRRLDNPDKFNMAWTQDRIRRGW